MSAPPVPGFDQVAAALKGAGSPAHAAEMHGSLCGLACLLGPASTIPWMAEVMEDAGPAGADTGMDDPVALLESLARASAAALEEGDMSFRPLLPDDEVLLTERAESLAHWCQGFAHGLAVGGELGDAREALGGDLMGEIIGDITELARVAFTGDETEAEGEAAYAELVEYLRVSVQLVFEEMRPARERAAARSTH
jgi:uncharacterized protein YgfB (UPF0149 family)